MSFGLSHGRIAGVTVTTPDLDAALDDYRDRLGLCLVERGEIAPELAASWGTPATARSAFATLKPASGAPCLVRLVEQPVPQDFVPVRSYGWAAYELTVQDVFGWPAKLVDSGFDIVGPPRAIPGLPYFVAMQMTGRGREMIYLNEVACDTPTSDLPRAACPVDHAFIVILATPDADATCAWYRDRLQLDIGGRYDIEYTMINKAFDLPPTHLTTLAMMQKGRLPIVEVDSYPASATVRPGPADRLPAGNALVSLAVDDLDALDLPLIAPPLLIEGRRTATMRGPAGELIELIDLRH